MRWGHVAGAAALVIALIHPGGIAPGQAVADQLGKLLAVSPPQPAPEISFADAEGKSFGLGDFAGKTLLLNLWATWCAPCVKEMPSLERLQELLGDKMTVVAISQDRGGAKAVEPFVGKLGLKLVKVYLDPKSAVGRAFKVEGLPSSFLIDREGRLVGRVEGEADWDSPKMLEALQPFLAGDGVVKASLPQGRP